MMYLSFHSLTFRYVVDTGNFRIKKYNTADNLVQSFPIGLRHEAISSCGITVDDVSSRVK